MSSASSPVWVKIAQMIVVYVNKTLTSLFSQNHWLTLTHYEVILKKAASNPED